MAKFPTNYKNETPEVIDVITAEQFNAKTRKTSKREYDAQKRELNAMFAIARLANTYGNYPDTPESFIYRVYENYSKLNNILELERALEFERAELLHKLFSNK